MDELNKNHAERIRISGILRNTLVMPQFRHIYFGDAYTYTAKSFVLERNLTGIGDTASGIASIISGSVNWNKINFELPAMLLSADSTIDVSIRGSRLHPFPAVQYKVQEVVRKKAASSSDFTVKVELPLTDTVVIEKDQEYTLQVAVKTHEMTCTIVFSCPKGKMDFEFLRVE
jgi:hypothetical protein